MNERSLLDLTVSALVTALRAREVDVRALVEALCARLETRNPSILAFLPEPDRRERLLREARDLEARYPAGTALPTLYGLPVAVKDVIRADGFATRAGSALPAELFAGPEAWVVTRLRHAGALILGKSVTTEFAYFEPGATRNPRGLPHTPGGSSSGSAAAVAARLVPLALGTQTVGSVIRPGAYCGVAAFKPSLGRVSSAGVVYYSPSVDTVGWFASDVAGLAEAAGVLIEDWHTPPPETHPPRPPRVAVPAGPYLEQAEPVALEAFAATLERLAAAGVEVYRAEALADIEGVKQRHQWLTAYEFAAQHRDWYDVYGALYRPRSSLLIEEGRAITSAQHDAGRESATALRRELAGLMDVHALDAWVSPAAPGPAPLGLGSTGSPVMNTPWTHAGLPVVTIPAGSIQGLPLGLQLAGRHGDDETLLSLAAHLEGRLVEPG